MLVVVHIKGVSRPGVSGVIPNLQSAFTAAPTHCEQVLESVEGFLNQERFNTWNRDVKQCKDTLYVWPFIC